LFALEDDNIADGSWYYKVRGCHVHDADNMPKGAKNAHD
jgi:hypothetical protein